MQTELMRKAEEREQRAIKFVAKYLELLEHGGIFGDLDRFDLSHTVQMDEEANKSLQHRKLIITSEITASVDVVDHLHQGGSRLKAATLRGVKAIATLRPSQVVNAFRPQEVAKSTEKIVTKTVGAVHTVGTGTVALATHLKDQVEGPRETVIVIKDLIGVTDFECNPTSVQKYGEAASRSFGLMYVNEGEQCVMNLRTESEDEKRAWLGALQELKVLSDDAGAELLLVKRDLEKQDKHIKQSLAERRKDRQAKVAEDMQQRERRQSTEY
mmetsp:Transcript_7846/g.12477  ORF Transcript_7846/g.12477 Transcript_7846/m.12477 type:complete len:270 (+) Transcript_7846:309-1118(+)